MLSALQRWIAFVQAWEMLQDSMKLPRHHEILAFFPFDTKPVNISIVRFFSALLLQEAQEEEAEEEDDDMEDEDHDDGHEVIKKVDHPEEDNWKEILKDIFHDCDFLFLGADLI